LENPLVKERKFTGTSLLQNKATEQATCARNSMVQTRLTNQAVETDEQTDVVLLMAFEIEASKCFAWVDDNTIVTTVKAVNTTRERKKICKVNWTQHVNRHN
jgi:hypothetical protein